MEESCALNFLYTSSMDRGEQAYNGVLMFQMTIKVPPEGYNALLGMHYSFFALTA